MITTQAGMLLTASLLLIASGCRTHHVVETYSEVKPIHITIDVNLRVDNALNEFFSDIDKPKENTKENKKPGTDTK